MTLTQASIKQSVKTGGWNVTQVKDWAKVGHFNSKEELRGALKLAYQQGLDGMGKSIAHWMGLSQDEYDLWMRNEDALIDKIYRSPQ